jgi:hypothetical protein
LWWFFILISALNTTVVKLSDANWRLFEASIDIDGVEMWRAILVCDSHLSKDSLLHEWVHFWAPESLVRYSPVDIEPFSGTAKLIRSNEWVMGGTSWWWSGQDWWRWNVGRKLGVESVGFIIFEIIDITHHLEVGAVR